MVSESMIKMVITEVLKRLPDGTGEQVGAFLSENMQTVENVKEQLNRMETTALMNNTLLEQILELLKNDNRSNPTGKRKSAGNPE